jgi:hypothetical protein
MKKYEKIKILIAENIDSSGTMFTKECLKKVAKNTGQVKLTLGYDGAQIGLCQNFKFSKSTLFSDIIFDREKQDLGVNLYPCISGVVNSLSYKTIGREEQRIIEDMFIVYVGMCDSHADKKIKPLKIKEGVKK